MSILITILAELLKDALPPLLEFLWEKSHEPTTVEDAASDNARRDRLLDAIHERLRRNAGGDDPDNPAAPTR
jgi:hypothetical protein